MLAGVGAAGQPAILHHLADVSGAIREARHTVDDVDHEMEAVEVIEHDHVERRGGRPLFLVAADMQVVVIRAPIGEPMDQPGVAVVGEHDRL